MFGISFANARILEAAIEESPLVIAGCWFSLQRWPRDKALQEIDFNVVPVWIQVHMLPIDFMTAKNAEIIGRKLGQLVMAEDPLADGVGRGFLRIRVRIDVRRPLMTGFWIPRPVNRRIWANLKYEKLYGFCFNCGRVGHLLKSCAAEVRAEDCVNPMMMYGVEMRAEPVRQNLEIRAMGVGVEGGDRAQAVEVEEGSLFEVKEVKMSKGKNYAISVTDIKGDCQGEKPATGNSRDEILREGEEGKGERGDEDDRYEQLRQETEGLKQMMRELSIQYGRGCGTASIIAGFKPVSIISESRYHEMGRTKSGPWENFDYCMEGADYSVEMPEEVEADERGEESTVTRAMVSLSEGIDRGIMKRKEEQEGRYGITKKARPSVNQMVETYVNKDGVGVECVQENSGKCTLKFEVGAGTSGISRERHYSSKKKLTKKRRSPELMEGGSCVVMEEAEGLGGWPEAATRAL